ncbi:MAG TPA: PAS domain S-box protein [Blastocatellia bacterium]|nr:PAS domain S-box protein [Blastocatellia bacterium]
MAEKDVKTEETHAYERLEAGGEVAGGMGTEKMLRESLAQMASVIGSAMDAIISIDGRHRIVLFNAAAEKMFGYAATDAIGQPIDRFIPERFRNAHSEHVNKFGRANITKRSMGSLGAIFGLRRNGEEFPIEASISHAESNGLKLYTVIIRDITERKRTEGRLREQAALLDKAQDAILVRDLEDHILFWNHGAERIYGWPASEVTGKKIRDLIYMASLDLYEKAKQQLLENGEWQGELRQMTRDGREIIAQSRWTLVRDDLGNPKSVLVINTDVTERRKIEAQFLRAQRMESIGTLAGGLAHDFNNILSPILMSIQMLKARFPDEGSQRLLMMLETSAVRGAGLVKQVLSFARGVEGERVILQPRHLIKEIVKIFKDTLPKSIEVECNAPDELWTVAGDATQLHQVLMNLCVNARDALPAGGKLRLEAENVYIDDNYARMNLDAKPGRFVLITISDTGVGIPAGIVDKIFEPFFTTKEHGKGTGLGLSTAMAIVRSHGGFITVYSEVGRGTQFRIHIPAVAATHSGKVDESQPDLTAGHGELVLVVDDEEAIREITKSTLETYGYRAITANDGTEAVAMYAQHGDEIKAVLTDMMMPYMDGPATIRALQKLNPQVRIIASSGLTENSKTIEAAGAGVKIFLSKPYTAEKLLKALAELLG